MPVPLYRPPAHRGPRQRNVAHTQPRPARLPANRVGLVTANKCEGHATNRPTAWLTGGFIKLMGKLFDTWTPTAITSFSICQRKVTCLVPCRARAINLCVGVALLLLLLLGRDHPPSAQHLSVYRALRVATTSPVRPPTCVCSVPPPVARTVASHRHRHRQPPTLLQFPAESTTPDRTVCTRPSRACATTTTRS